MAGLRERIFGALRGTREQVKPMAEQGVGGYAIFGGYLQVQETSSKLMGKQRWKTALDILSNISTVAASVRFMLNLVARPDWRFEPAIEDSPEADQYAEFMEDVINDMDASWTRIVRRAAMYRYDGFGIHEWVAKKRDDGKIGLASLEPRPSHTIELWDIDPNGGILGVWQRDPQTAELRYLPRGKILYLVDDGLTDRPDGMGWFRHLVDPAERIKALLNLEAVGFERDLRGIPVGRAPIAMMNQMVADGELTQQQADDMLNGLKNFVSIQRKTYDTGIVLDSKPYENKTDTGINQASALLWDMDLLTGDAGSLAELDKAIKRMQTDMAMIMGTEVMMVGRDGQGARALSEDKSRNLYLNGNAILADMAEAVDRDLTDVIWKMNGFPPEMKPKAVFEDVAFKNAKEMAQALNDMASAGAVLAPDDPAFDDIRAIMGLPKTKPIDGEMLAAVQGKPDLTADQEAQADGIAAPADEGGKSTKKAAPKPLYVRRQLRNAQDLINWAKQNGFETTLAAEKMHVTVLYSKVPIDWMTMGKGRSTVDVEPGGPRVIEPLGDSGAVVLSFRCREIEERHDEMVQLGAAHDFPSFQSHVTLTWDAPPDLDIGKLEPFAGRLIFGPEIFAPINEDWKDDLVEKGLVWRKQP